MKHLVLVSGYSGAGKTVALRALEDAGYAVVDNIPLKLLTAVVDTALEEEEFLAIGSDIRTYGFSMEDFSELLASLRRREGLECRLLMLVADADTLLGRFKETRRPHPLATDRPIMDGIQAEFSLLRPMRALADEVLDTTGLNPRELQRSIQQQFASDAVPFHVEVLSFSYKFGIPRGADVVFDVRFLQNPHYVEHLRPLTGQDVAVGEYIRQDERFQTTFERLKELVLMTVPWYHQEGKRSLMLAIGCTGGKHRSVYMVERLAEALRRSGVAVTVRHREIQATNA